MAFDKVIDSAKLDAGMSATANAIRAKTGGRSPIAWDEETGFKTAVEVISNGGGVELPALDNPGTAGDLAKGKQLIGADGSVIEGSVTEHTPASMDLYKSVDRSDWVCEYDPEDNNYCLHSKTAFINDAIVRKGAAVSQYVWGNELGNAKQEDVAQGVTFTSENGLKLEGTLPTPNGREFEAEMVKAENWTCFYAEGTVGEDVLLRKGKFVGIYVDASKVGDFGTATPADVASGKTFTSKKGYALVGTMEPGSGGVNTSDATATAGDIAIGKTAYVNGEMVTGTIEDGDMWYYYYHGDVSAYEEDGAICFDHAFDKDVLYRKGEHIILAHSDLGDASPEDVRKGKTFTTSGGVRVPGEWEPETGGAELPTLTNPEGTASDLAHGKQLISSNGTIVDGTLVEKNNLQIGENVRVETDDGTIEMVAPVTTDCILRNGSLSRLIANSSAFGNASPSDVRKGVYFTSTFGVHVEGEMEPATDEMEVESLSEIHYWTKKFAGNPYEEVYIRNGIYLGNIGSTIQYADDIAISGGSVVLVNPKEYTITSKASDADAVLLGKYVKAVTGIYRIPTDAPITYAAATQWTSAHLNASFGYKINVVQAVINTIVLSKDIAAYPENGEQDGFTYSYQGTIPRDTDGASMSVDGETLIFEGTATIESDTLIL